MGNSGAGMKKGAARHALIALALLAGCHRVPETEANAGAAANAFGNRAAELDAAAANDSAAAEAQAIREQADAVNSEIVASNRVVMPISGNGPDGGAH